MHKTVSSLTAPPVRVLVASLIGCLALSLTMAAPAGKALGGLSDELSSYRNIPLWDAGKVPLATGNGPLDAPFLTVFLPPEGKRNGGSVVIAPGGANIMLMYGAEGIDIAERYNDWGVTAFVLTYRLSPRYGDERRASSTASARFKWSAPMRPRGSSIRHRSASSASRPARTWARSVAAASRPGDAAAADPVERVSSRPDYLALVYGAGRATPGESLKDFPPTFLLSAAADQGPSLGNAQLFTDLTRAGATAEIHVYQKGRHGFGSGFGSPEFGDWMARAAALPEARRLPSGETVSMERIAFPVAGLATMVAVLVDRRPARQGGQ